MKIIDFIIGCYASTIIIYILFLILAGRFDMLLFATPLALIPLVITLIQRRRV